MSFGGVIRHVSKNSGEHLVSYQPKHMRQVGDSWQHPAPENAISMGRFEQLAIFYVHGIQRLDHYSHAAVFLLRNCQRRMTDSDLLIGSFIPPRTSLGFETHSRFGYNANFNYVTRTALHHLRHNQTIMFRLLPTGSFIIKN